MIVQAIVQSFFTDILQGIHQPTDVYRLALYSSNANLSRSTPAYTTEEEVIGSPGYDAGGQVLTGFMVGTTPADTQDPNKNAWSTLDWNDPSWPYATITARGGLVYNATKQNRAVAVIDFGKNFVSTNGSWSVIRPEPWKHLIMIR